MTSQPPSALARKGEGMARLIAWLRKMLSREDHQPKDAWLIDRDGRVFKPERKIVLKAKG